MTIATGSWSLAAAQCHEDGEELPLEDALALGVIGLNCVGQVVNTLGLYSIEDQVERLRCSGRRRFGRSLRKLI